jgi:hypothetical protein
LPSFTFLAGKKVATRGAQVGRFQRNFTSGNCVLGSLLVVNNATLPHQYPRALDVRRLYKESCAGASPSGRLHYSPRPIYPYSSAHHFPLIMTTFLRRLYVNESTLCAKGFEYWAIISRIMPVIAIHIGPKFKDCFLQDLLDRKSLVREPSGDSLINTKKPLYYYYYYYLFYYYYYCFLFWARWAGSCDLYLRNSLFC